MMAFSKVHITMATVLFLLFLLSMNVIYFVDDHKDYLTYDDFSRRLLEGKLTDNQDETFVDLSTLLTITDASFDFTQGQTTSTQSTFKGSQKETNISILLYNPAYWVPADQWNTKLPQCPINNCIFSTDKRNLRQHSAIMFVFTEAPGLPPNPPLTPAERDPDQVWIASWVEAPARHSAYGATYRNINWRGTINWTMSYTMDAEMYYPYGQIRKRPTPLAKNYSSIFQRKTKMAAWVVSNCNTQSHRQQYVTELRRHGVKIDIFGKCAGKRVDWEFISSNISQNYKFYLAFENSFCKDYITEKFFRYFPLDVIVVVRGAGNYSHFVSNDSFINTADFGSVKALADRLKYLNANETAYIQYLKDKDRYESLEPQIREMSLCALCEKLNNLDKYRKEIPDYGKHVNKCYPPPDL